MALSLDSPSHGKTYLSEVSQRGACPKGHVPNQVLLQRNSADGLGLVIAVYCDCSRAFRCPAKIGFSAWAGYHKPW